MFLLPDEVKVEEFFNRVSTLQDISGLDQYLILSHSALLIIPH